MKVVGYNSCHANTIDLQYFRRASRCSAVLCIQHGVGHGGLGSPFPTHVGPEYERQAMSCPSMAKLP